MNFRGTTEGVSEFPDKFLKENVYMTSYENHKKKHNFNKFVNNIVLVRRKICGLLKFPVYSAVII